MNQTESSINKIGRWIKNSITARMLMVGFLTLILLIPLFFVKDLIKERAQRQKDVVSEINDKWGSEVLIYGPVLKVPYKTYNEKSTTDTKTKEITTEKIEQIKYAYFFPEELSINSKVNPEIKSRGIYKTTVFNSKNVLTGTFTTPDFSEEDISSENIIWDKARVLLQTSNLKGVNDQVEISFGQNNYHFSTHYQAGNTVQLQKLQLHEMESKPLKSNDMPRDKAVSFTLNLSINGSEQIRFIPIGKTTEAQIVSNWKTSNFMGNFLPYNSEKISTDGFDAHWKILDINRPFSQTSYDYLPQITDYAFGVNFMIPVDEYQKSERAAKYGFLVIGLTFLTFFLIQTLSKIYIHPFQYLMIGLSLIMFYTLLIAISEHSSFLKAYLIAGSSVILLITFYSRSILKNFRFPLLIAISLSALYSFIYIIIQLESYALLVGSIGLFAILTGVMFASRKIDWEQEKI
ncbi:cell envelope integrity protein CreD [Leeuwenhoekiella sp. A16]|uniref:cell envelope integrity protein CreD n=1 Tax=unclassified Leeuwenhoekiella TaxID=2615029 RepID=UPI003A7FC159